MRVVLRCSDPLRCTRRWLREPGLHRRAALRSSPAGQFLLRRSSGRVCLCFPQWLLPAAIRLLPLSVSTWPWCRQGGGRGAPSHVCVAQKRPLRSSVPKWESGHEGSPPDPPRASRAPSPLWGRRFLRLRAAPRAHVAMGLDGATSGGCSAPLSPSTGSNVGLLASPEVPQGAPCPHLRAPGALPPHWPRGRGAASSALSMCRCVEVAVVGVRVSGVAFPTVFSSPGAGAILRGRRAPPTCPHVESIPHPPPKTPSLPLRPSRKAKCRGAPRTNRVWGSLKGFPGAQLPPNTSLPSGGIGAPYRRHVPRGEPNPNCRQGPRPRCGAASPAFPQDRLWLSPLPPSPRARPQAQHRARGPRPPPPVVALPVDVLCRVVVVRRAPASVPPSPHPLPECASECACAILITRDKADNNE